MKILENEFRKDLYKSLVEAGYTKDEAQRIVGAKYFSALKDKVLSKETINAILDNVSNDKFEESLELSNQLINDIQELTKMSNYLKG